jgi:hypothetical protein
MKLSPGQVKFHAPFWPTGRRPRFVGKANTLQLLETALVVEGHRQRLFMPVVDSFFLQALSEWTTITVPYSRILSFRRSRRLVLRVLVTLLFWAPAVLLAGSGVLSGEGSGASLLAGGLIALLVLPLNFLVVFRLLAPRNELVFRQADGRRSRLAFTIRSAKRQKAFAEQLAAYRKSALEQVKQVG